MDRKKLSFVNMTLVLFLVTLIASTALGFVYELTKAPIAQAKLAKEQKAIMEVVPVDSSAIGNVDIEKNVLYINKEKNTIVTNEKIAKNGGKAIDSLIFFKVKSGEELKGVAVKTFTEKGFSGRIQLMVGFLPNGTIHKIAVLSHKETPGLGTKMDGEFKEQFKNLDISKLPDKELHVTKSGEADRIDAITAATISSRAFCDATQRAYDIYMQTKK